MGMKYILDIIFFLYILKQFTIERSGYSYVLFHEDMHDGINNYLSLRSKPKFQS